MRSELFSAGEIRGKHEQVLSLLIDIPTYDLEYCDLDQGIQVLDGLVQGA